MTVRERYLAGVADHHAARHLRYVLASQEAHRAMRQLRHADDVRAEIDSVRAASYDPSVDGVAA